MSSDPDRLEEQLRTLTPAGPTVDREALLFRMGRASAPPRWPWQTTSLVGVLLSLALGLGWWQDRQRPPIVVERIRTHFIETEVPRAMPSSPPSPEWPDSDWPLGRTERSPYLRLQDHLLQHGLEGLAPVPQSVVPSLTRNELLQSLTLPEREEP